jgi:aryl-alcohol dehydrogenase-like predicted oxidoreductase
VALAWLLAKSPVMLPIPGASRITSAVDSAAAMHLVLTPADHADLDPLLAATVADWLQHDWPLAAVRFPGRDWSLPG